MRKFVRRLKAQKLQTDDIKAQIEKLFYFINKENKLIDDNFKDKVKFMFKKFVNAGKRICVHPKNAALHNALKKLGNNTRIKVCKFDKGKGVVILDSYDYYAKLDCIINDSSKFHEINQYTKVHPII